MKPGSLLNWLEAITNGIGKITSFLMIIVIFYMIVSIIERKFFNTAANFMLVVPNIFFTYIALGAAYAYNRKAFINIDVFYRQFSGRLRALVDLITSIFFFFFFVAILWLAGEYGLKALPVTRLDWRMLIEPTRWPVRIIFPIGLILLLIAGAVRLIRILTILITGIEEEAPVEEGSTR